MRGRQNVIRRKAPRPLTRGERVCAFIERYCRVPEGKLVGKPLKLEPFQRQFILAVYDNPAVTRRAYLSIARKNGKTGLIAGILLAHIAGPEARLNSQIISGALSREQAGVVFNLAAKMVRMDEDLTRRVRIIPSGKRLVGLSLNVEYHASSAEAKTAHGGSPVLTLIDEAGQIRGPQSDFIDAITTGQGAHEDPLVIVISTQAASDNDLFSIWLDDARTSADPHIVSHVYAAPEDCELADRMAWKLSNPALGTFRSLKDLEEQAERAARMPSFEPTFRNLGLNQRVETVSPFISKSIWLLNSFAVEDAAFSGADVFGGLDLSGRTALTSLVLLAELDGRHHLKAFFWTPEEGLRDRSKADRVPYDLWVEQGFIRTTPGRSIDYGSVAQDIVDAVDGMQLRAIAFDRWRIDVLRKELERIGADLPLVEFGQGFKDMAPAIDGFEGLLLNERIAHGNNPVLTYCMNSARVERDAAGNRKLNKVKSKGRIDGAVAAVMAAGMVPDLNGVERSFWESVPEKSK